MPSKLTHQQFLDRANAAHPDKYNYEKVNYVNNKTKVEIICPMHGEFWQTPDGHLRARACPKCSWARFARNQTKTTVFFKEKGTTIHKGKFNYSLVDYINSGIKVKIICPIHGIFEQTPRDHLQGHGCDQCSGTYKSNTEDFKKKASLVHPGLFSYEKSVYVNTDTPLIIICKIHGEFKQSPHSHLNGTGCKKCTKVVSAPETQWLNFLNVPIDYRENINFRIGDQLIRPDACDQVNKIIYEFYGDYWHGNPAKFDSNKENANNGKNFGELYQATIDREKLLEDNGYKIVSIWESEWNKIVKQGADK